MLTGAGPGGLYHNRNRWYSPDLGRFISRDPNESALPIVVALTRNGESWSILLGAFDATAHYGDGMNLYLYLGGNPINGLDALGLWNDPFDEIDEIIYALTGGRAAAAHHALHTIGSMAQQTAIAAIKVTIAAMYPPYGLYLSIEGTAIALENMLDKGITWQNSAVLGMSLAGVRASWGPAMGRMQSDMFKLVRGVRSGYRTAANRYARMGMSRSRFNNRRPTVVPTGQIHHAISKTIWKSLEKNARTRGFYGCRDSRFVTRAADDMSHRGYQEWHRAYDREVSQWILRNKPTPAQFESYLHNYYAHPKMLQRFPEGL